MELRTRPVTEEEAKRKFCPFTFTPPPPIPGPHDLPAASCIASQCMLWRFKNMGTTELVEPVGYCGAGGEP